ncbi:uncharacterized protein CCOS01_06833 [Colletotrichum costaricense]|uniref:Uncharacterized protein n=1 Tax=Colletotrichum costaricense TaxID=1209916 RepID=A0AAI9YYV2_9PEZI|nr:uncharacterized protein CCOS01_06833 [Colletotrichum costaricense]KAK1528999.1 hypothetical protein CCOS01_06833 [Colletotrichum costaricense]
MPFFLSFPRSIWSFQTHAPPPPKPQDKTPKLLGRLNRPASTELHYCVPVHTSPGRLSSARNHPHPCPRMQVCLCLWFCLYLSPSLLSAVLCFSSSSPALLVCVPALPTPTLPSRLQRPHVPRVHYPSPCPFSRTLAMVPAAFYPGEWHSFKSSRLAGSPCEKIQTFGSAPSLSTLLVINRPRPSRPREALFSSIPLDKSNYGEADFSDSLNSLLLSISPLLILL